ncbi:hypothetical protein [Cytobacillus praedii]|uniref:hypothetical protein n=1 Tax=Cytobacillus praedii TaxID=1742358 RepID=UPI0013F490D3|nr:hypothetical protein [Cytobacillus praedii]
MVFSVDFAIQIKGDFHTVYSALIQAESVTECKNTAQEIRENLLENSKQEILIFIEQ